MSEHEEVTRRFDRVLDAFASRLGTSVAVSVLMTVSVCIALYVNSLVGQLEQNHAVFRDRDLRNGYVTLSDIQRLLLIARTVEREGQLTTEHARAFAQATDVLYVRVEAFRKTIDDVTWTRSGVAAITSLEQFVSAADALHSDGFKNPSAGFEQLLNIAIDTRRYLIQFLDEMNRQADALLDKQSKAVRVQKYVLLISLLIVALFMLGSLLLLRREVLGRRARERAEKRVKFLAFFDPLTQLPNRAQFQDRIQAMLNADQAFALLYIDLDGFKLVNDTYGHDAGDMVLRHVGDRLDFHSQFYNGFAARLGGDEFAMVVPSDNLVKLTSLCQKLLHETEEAFSFDGESFDIGFSIGIATTAHMREKTDLTLDLLSRVADFALYASKSAGRGRYTFYNHELEAKFQERRSMLEDLPRAIENDDLEVHLQPKVTLADKKVYGFEALVRWRRDGILVPPNNFIQIAEESGLVVDIDHYVLKNATKFVADWNAKHGTDFSVSVNLSALNFTSLRIIEWVQDALWTSLLHPDRLVLEITETMEMRDWKHAKSIIAGLRKLGCKIAIDDFGTGYSSLAYLRTTAADELKIDRSLVMELETSKRARLLMSSVLDIARNLNFEVTVEGIETEAQADIVRKMGAENGQGYLYSRPQLPEVALQDATPGQNSALRAAN